MKKWKRISTAVMTVVMILSMSACGAGQSAASGGTNGSASPSAKAAGSKDTLNVVYHLLPNGSLDPLTDYNYYLVRAGVAETLFQVDDQMKVVPWLAKSSKADKDSTEWIITLNSGIVFSNGDPCDAAAVKSSLQRMIDGGNAQAKGLDIVKMSAEGLTLTITTKTPKPTLISELAHPQMCIVDVKSGNFKQNPIGTGPYKIKSYELKVGVHLTKNDKYWDGAVPFENVSFTCNSDPSARLMSLQSGDADLITKPSTDSLSAIEKDASLKYVMSDIGVRADYLSYNCARKYVSDTNFRKGVDSLINKQQILSTIFHDTGTVADGVVPDGTDFTPKYVPRAYDVNAALGYFQKAGLKVENGKVTDNGAPITLLFNTYSSQSEFPVVAQLIQSSLASVGINAKISECAVDINSYLGDTANNNAWDISMTTMFVFPRGDGAYGLNTCFGKSSIYNYTKATDNTLQGMIDQINSEGNVSTRTDEVKKAALYEADQCYISWILNPKNIVAYNATSIQNVSSAEFYIVTKDITKK